MKYLLFNWDMVDGDTIPNLSELSDEEFERIAEEHGQVIDTHEDFEHRFNAEYFSTHTHQLRIIDCPVV